MARDLPGGSFAFAPSSLWADADLSKTAVRVGLYIATYANRKGQCRRSASTMALALSYRRQTVAEALDELVERGHVERISRPGQPSLYVLQYRVPDVPTPDRYERSGGDRYERSGDAPEGDRQEQSPGDRYYRSGGEEPDRYERSGVTATTGHNPNESEGRRTPNDEVEEARAIFDEMASRLAWPTAQHLTANERSDMTARLRDCGGLDGWRRAMQEAERSPTYLPRIRPDIRFFLREDNFAQLMRGRYGAEFDRQDQDVRVRGIAGAETQERGLTAALNGILNGGKEDDEHERSRDGP